MGLRGEATHLPRAFPTVLRTIYNQPACLALGGEGCEDWLRLQEAPR